jgi:hypothetical protein
MTTLFNDIKLSQVDSELNSYTEQFSEKMGKNADLLGKIVMGYELNSVEDSKSSMAMQHLSRLGSRAVSGDVKAKAEINALQKIIVERAVTKRLSLANVFSNHTTVGYNSALEVEYYELTGEKAREQAAAGSFPFPVAVKKTTSVETKTITGGVAINYRELASGNVDGLRKATEEVITYMVNYVIAAHYNALVTGISSATTMKNYVEGLTATNVGTVIGKARPIGKPALLGDYNVVSQLAEFTGFQTVATPSTVQFADSIIDEVNRTGLLSVYKGNAVVEIPNAYDYSTTEGTGDNRFFKKLLSDEYLLVVPGGSKSPLATVHRGGLTSATGFDVNSGLEVTRYDFEFGHKIIPELIPYVGLIKA